ncbi:Chromate resistance protein ChrB [Vallicoccus soli]|uniref:Chromate resistance protein n=1 Tax=Vallicoccus soli TaxID=2339232 RepID=A0A3A3ZLL1_9ACTN|nr:Chromate resistance protein ChrB [Vallicoccus soli]RJK97136.1 chromate resistance protein [Vallicoccus soli]
MVAQESPGEWVLLQYRLPREPSTPRSAVWRRLRALGVAQLGDGLVALPHDARTREQLDWVAAEVREASGTAALWLARPATAAQEAELARTMARARAEEYRAVRDEALAGLQRTGGAGAASLPPAEHARLVKRLRAELRRVRRRDFSAPPERAEAVAAVEELARAAAAAPVAAGRHP